MATDLLAALQRSLYAVRLEQRLKAAYFTAMKHAHDGGRVELHLGQAAIEYLESLAVREDDLAPAAGMIGQTCWGFPVQGVANNPAHVSVHVVHDIH